MQEAGGEEGGRGRRGRRTREHGREPYAHLQPLGVEPVHLAVVEPVCVHVAQLVHSATRDAVLAKDDAVLGAGQAGPRHEPRSRRTSEISVPVCFGSGSRESVEAVCRGARRRLLVAHTALKGVLISSSSTSSTSTSTSTRSTRSTSGSRQTRVVAGAADGRHCVGLPDSEGVGCVRNDLEGRGQAADVALQSSQAVRKAGVADVAAIAVVAAAPCVAALLCGRRRPRGPLCCVPGRVAAWWVRSRSRCIAHSCSTDRGRKKAGTDELLT